MQAVSVRRWVAVAAVVAVLLAGCSLGTPGATPPLESVGVPTQPTASGTSTAPLPTPTTVTPVNRADLLIVYRAWWKAVQEAFASGDATSPDMALYGADPILSRERNQIRTFRDQGVVQRTQLTLSPRVVQQEDITAEIADCVRGPAGTYYDITTGTPRAPRGYRNELPTQDPLLVSLHKRGGYWFVVAATNKGVQPC